MAVTRTVLMMVMVMVMVMMMMTMKTMKITCMFSTDMTVYSPASPSLKGPVLTLKPYSFIVE